MSQNALTNLEISRGSSLSYNYSGKKIRDYRISESCGHEASYTRGFNVP